MRKPSIEMISLRPNTGRRLVGCAAIAMVCAAAIAAFAMAAPEGTTGPTESDDRVEALAQLTAPLAAGKQLKMAAILKLHDRLELDQLIGEQQDPSSQHYHDWLTPGSSPAASDRLVLI